MRVWALCRQVCHPALIILTHASYACLATGNYPQLRRGRSLLAREEDVHESGLALFKRGATLRRKRTQPTTNPLPPTPDAPAKKKRGCWKGPGPGGPWMIYCLILTCWIPPFLLRSCGKCLHIPTIYLNLLSIKASAVQNSSEHGGKRWGSLASSLL